MSRTVEIDKSAARVDFRITDGDTRTYRFTIKDPTGAVVEDPEGDGWELFGQVRAKRGGTVIDDQTFTFDGSTVIQELPDTGPGTFWHEYQITNPDGQIATTVTGHLYVDVDSAVPE